MSAFVFFLTIILFGLLGVHHFVKARRGVRTGVVEGLMLGYGRKTYSREQDPAAFQANVSAGYCAAILGAICVLWGTSIVVIMILASFGIGPWP